MKKIYIHKEITKRELDSIISANLNLKQLECKTLGFNPIGILNQMIFKFLNDNQIDYITKKIEE